jgi:DNA polymerase (family 10)
VVPTNREIASALKELADLTILEDGTPQSFRVRAYEKAARSVQAQQGPVAGMEMKALSALAGVGEGTARKIRELADSGHIAKLDALRSQYPPPFVEVARIPGIGPKTALTLRSELGIESVGDLKVAVEAGLVRRVAGLGARTEANIGRAIEELGLATGEKRFPIAEAMRIALDVAGALADVPGVTRVEPMGSLRRLMETVGDIDLLVVSAGEPARVVERFLSLPIVARPLASGQHKASVTTVGGIQVDLRVVEPDQYGAAAVYFTGSKAHNVKLRQRAIERRWSLNEYGLFDASGAPVAGAASEGEVYSALGMQWVPPEVREDEGEVELSAAGRLPRYLSQTDLRGDLHVHTDLSGDGHSSLAEMVGVAAHLGYQYLAITDHAQDLTINGVSREEMVAQREQIAALMRRQPGITILHGVELNIGADGSVDYDPEFLAGFDWVIASVHSHFHLDQGAQTRRVLAAMRNPLVAAVAHLTGRRIGLRPGIDLDLDAVLSAAEETGTALEINAHLERLDVTTEVLRSARGRDVTFVIGTDAHAVAELGNAEWGVRHARRGWVDPERVANTWSASRLLAWLATQRGNR